MKVGAVILAAGYSSRMGDFKPLLQLNGRSMISHVIDLFQSVSVDQIVVVTGHRSDELKQIIERSGALFVKNPLYEQGMFSSVCAAMQYFREVDGFFVLPVDIPLIRPATLDILLSHFDGERVLYPQFLQERGHPPLIPSSCIPAIMNHNGVGGLQVLLEKFPFRDIPVWDQSILMDADTPEDFTALKERVKVIDIGSRDEVMALAESYMPARGVAHGLAVAQIGYRLAEVLNRKGMNLDSQRIYNAGLLHDIAKGQPDHEAQGGILLRKLGFGGLADIVAAHRDAGKCVSGNVTEKEIVCLADKCVRGITRMSIYDRFSEKLVKYANDPDAVDAITSRLTNVLALQEKVEKVAGMSIKKILEV